MEIQSTSDVVTSHLRELLHSGALEPGGKILSEDLAARLGVSSTPVRDALKRLEIEGLVEIVPRAGAYARVIQFQEVREAYAIKEMLEPLLARWVTLRGTAAERQEFADSSAKMMAAAEEGKVAEYVDLFDERRTLFIKVAESSVLADVFRTIDGRVRHLRTRNLAQPGRLIQSAREHEAISNAILDGDAQQAAALAQLHVQRATQSLFQLSDLKGKEPKV
jgi:DNA-binding GntR family transcriptional regulator